MSNCFNNTAEVGCYTDVGGALITVSILRTYDNEGKPATRIVDIAGDVVAGATLANTTIGACVIAPITYKPSGGGAQIAGPVASAVVLGPFNGAPDMWDSSAVGGVLRSISVSARDVKDGLPGLTTDQVILDLPDGTKVAVSDGDSNSFSIVIDVDTELLAAYKVTATGVAYATVTYTFV